MNAPWKAGGTARDAFNAFVCDDNTHDIVRSVCEDMGWAPEKANKGGLRNAIQSLSVSASPNILLVDLSESGDPLNDINALAEVCEPGTVVIAVGQINDVRLYRDLMVSGLHDYLLKPFSPDALRDSITQAQTMMNAPKADDDSAARSHISTAIIGTRGGVGASTISTSLAWLLSDRLGRMTALLDLDVHFGTGALSLDLEPGRGLTDAIDNPSRIDGLFIERAMIKANDKLSLLSAEAPISSPIMTDGTAFFQLQEEFRSAFEATIIDLPRNMLINYPHLVHDAQVCVVVTELTLAAARDTIRLLAWLKANAPHSRIILVANKVQTAALEISKKDFESSVEHKIDFMVPSDPKSAAQASKLGKPIVEAARTSKVSAAIKGIADRLVGQADEIEQSEAASNTGTMGKGGSKAKSSFSFASLLPSKTKA